MVMKDRSRLGMALGRALKESCSAGNTAEGSR